MNPSTLSIVLTQDLKLHKTFGSPDTQSQRMQHMKTHKILKSKEMRIFINAKMTVILKLSDKNFNAVVGKQSKQAAVNILETSKLQKVLENRKE